VGLAAWRRSCSKVQVESFRHGVGLIERQGGPDQVTDLRQVGVTRKIDEAIAARDIHEALRLTKNTCSTSWPRSPRLVSNWARFSQFIENRR
jgi:hypothetical protein